MDKSVKNSNENLTILLFLMQNLTITLWDRQGMVNKERTNEIWELTRRQNEFLAM